MVVAEPKRSEEVTREVLKLGSTQGACKDSSIFVALKNDTNPSDYEHKNDDPKHLQKVHQTKSIFKKPPYRRDKRTLSCMQAKSINYQSSGKPGGFN
jgi:hypothetical protein